MRQELINIFVPFDLAKLAYEKQFSEWCACLVSKKTGHSPNFIEKFIRGGFETLFDFKDKSNIYLNGFYSCPTHLQLIIWLKNNHKIDVTMGHNGLWSVLNQEGHLVYQNDECFFEINQALEIGLKLVNL